MTTAVDKAMAEADTDRDTSPSRWGSTSRALPETRAGLMLPAQACRTGARSPSKTPGATNTTTTNTKTNRRESRR